MTRLEGTQMTGQAILIVPVGSFEVDEDLTTMDGGNDLSFNLNLIDTGEAPIDTGFNPISGRVVGESEDHYAFTLDFSYNWR